MRLNFRKITFFLSCFLLASLLNGQSFSLNCNVTPFSILTSNPDDIHLIEADATGYYITSKLPSSSPFRGTTHVYCFDYQHNLQYDLPITTKKNRSQILISDYLHTRSGLFVVGTKYDKKAKIGYNYFHKISGGGKSNPVVADGYPFKLKGVTSPYINSNHENSILSVWRVSQDSSKVLRYVVRENTNGKIKDKKMRIFVYNHDLTLLFKKETLLPVADENLTKESVFVTNRGEVYITTRPPNTYKNPDGTKQYRLFKISEAATTEIDLKPLQGLSVGRLELTENQNTTYLTGLYFSENVKTYAKGIFAHPLDGSTDNAFTYMLKESEKEKLASYKKMQNYTNSLGTHIKPSWYGIRKVFTDSEGNTKVLIENQGELYRPETKSEFLRWRNIQNMIVYSITPEGIEDVTVVEKEFSTAFNDGYAFFAEDEIGLIVAGKHDKKKMLSSTTMMGFRQIHLNAKNQIVKEEMLARGKECAISFNLRQIKGYADKTIILAVSGSKTKFNREIVILTVE